MLRLSLHHQPHNIDAPKRMSTTRQLPALFQRICRRRSYIPPPWKSYHHIILLIMQLKRLHAAPQKKIEASQKERITHTSVWVHTHFETFILKLYVLALVWTIISCLQVSHFTRHLLSFSVPDTYIGRLKPPSSITGAVPSGPPLIRAPVPGLEGTARRSSQAWLPEAMTQIWVKEWGLICWTSHRCLHLSLLSVRL